ncbi:UDP-N-acetylmuramate dehydrogenase [Paraburkholderia caribensis]|uniref:UDP-N-acetylenolpyruvoylglucosamine reductase n=1 Tax=Paraburkholderia caribensis TaxID=75105 RepID=A0ABV0E8Z6_9BURK|nr:UDP-N-acetylmuramate dehydrogenase [Paraburkholderia caribensis]MCO4882709.1 UDP-N-acetylmuramate dehydrogenase [Paraburkholderia caribensis]PTB23821.1 UDP-N-acetylenolpyruvoylglucosamine reductase [Paraburkholderia caribensis]
MDTPKILHEVNLEYANSYRLVSICGELLLPRCVDDVVEMFERDGTPSFPILGHGCNVILSRARYPRVMKFGRRFGTVTRLDDHVVFADAGASLRRVGLACERFGLAGFEFLGNIPGSVGGGIVMNAGAFGHELAGVVQSVRVYAIHARRVIELTNSECEWGYRSSGFQNGAYVVLGAYFRLHDADPRELRMRRLSNRALRRERFPVSEPNAGSVFKRPSQGLKIGEMIEALGHKGFAIGTARISPKHAGFIVVRRPGRANDICRLIDFMQSEMREHFDVEAEIEQRIL